MNAQPPNPGLRQSTLESLGYICEEMGKIEEDVLAQEQINAILTSVVEVKIISMLPFCLSTSVSTTGHTIFTRLPVCHWQDGKGYFNRI